MTSSKTWTLGAAFLSGALLLASCGGGEAPNPQPEPQPQPTYGDSHVISGDIEPDQELPTVVKVPLLSESNVDGLKNLQAPVDAQGRFTLTLPDTVTMSQSEDLLGAGETFGCFDPAAVSAPAGNLFFPVRYVAGDNGRSYFNKTDSGAENEATVKRMRVFAKQDAQIKISPTATCPVTADLSLKAGWNVVEEALPVTEGSSSSYRMTTLPAGAVVFRDTKLFAGSVFRP